MNTKPIFYLLHLLSRIADLGRSIVFFCIILFFFVRVSNAQEFKWQGVLFVVPNAEFPSVLPIDNTTTTGNDILNQIFEDFHVVEYSYVGMLKTEYVVEDST